jgi:hypothetical protein
MSERNAPPIEPETRTELAEWLDNESANTSDAEFGMKLASLAEEQYMKVEETGDDGDDTGRWCGESGFPEGHPSQLIADISNEFGESTSDTHILLDALWTKDLTLVSPEWRESMAVQLDREVARIAILLGNAAQIVRTLKFEGDDKEVTEPQNPFAPIDEALKAYRSQGGHT